MADRVDLDEVRRLYVETEDSVDWACDPWDALGWLPALAGEVERLRAELGRAITRANSNARLAADNADERDTATDRERERITNWFAAEADLWRIKHNTEARCEYDRAAQMVRDLDPGGAR